MNCLVQYIPSDDGKKYKNDKDDKDGKDDKDDKGGKDDKDGKDGTFEPDKFNEIDFGKVFSLFELNLRIMTMNAPVATACVKLHFTIFCIITHLS